MIIATAPTFLDANPRVCWAILVPTKEHGEDDKLGSAAIDEELGIDFLDKILGRMFIFGMFTQSPLPSEDDRVDTDLPNTETPP